jgi:uncharacterized protein (TIRG00374 family)
VRKNVQLFIGLGVSLLALALAFRGANLGVMADALRKANYFLLLVGVVFYVVGLLFRAMSWRVILGGRVPFWRVFDALNEGYLLNNLLPFRLGEFGRAYLISQRNDLPPFEALSSIVVERVIDLLMVVVLLLIFLPLIASVEADRAAVLSSIALAVIAVVALVIVARNQDRMARLVGRVLRYLHLSWLHPDVWEARAASFLAGLGALRDAGRAAKAALFSFLAWAAAGAGAWVILNAFLPGASATMAFVTLALVGIAGGVPSAPGSAGVFEIVVVGSLAIFKVDKSVALSFGLVLHAVNFLLAVGLGGIALAREGETVTHLARSAQALLASSRRSETAEAAAPKE